MSTKKNTRVMENIEIVEDLYKKYQKVHGAARGVGEYVEYNFPKGRTPINKNYASVLKFWGKILDIYGMREVAKRDGWDSGDFRQFEKDIKKGKYTTVMAQQEAQQAVQPIQPIIENKPPVISQTYVSQASLEQTIKPVVQQVIPDEDKDKYFKEFDNMSASDYGSLLLSPTSRGLVQEYEKIGGKDRHKK